MSLSTGARLGAYEILALIGAGGMGEVYRARDTRLDRIVAIKVLPPELAGDPQFRERFDREARTISQLDHPNICALYDVGIQGDTAYLVMQYLEGETLADRLAKGSIGLGEAQRVAIEIATALDNAHSVGVVHRDLKPGNVFLTKTGAKLLDFGLAKTATPVVAGVSGARTPTFTPTAMATTPALTAQGTILGTFRYMAPEQLEGEEADFRTDIFAFGAVVYEMVTGRKAFQGRTQVSLIGAILKDDPPPLSTLQTTAPAALDWVVRKCLAKDPAARWQSARDLVSQLEWIAQGGSAPVAPAGALSAPSRAVARERAAWSAAALMTVAVIGFVAWHFGRPSPPPVSVRFQFPAPAGTAFAETLLNFASHAVSPDGRRVAFVINTEGKDLIAVRAFDTLQPQVLAGTEGATSPFWSPDSRLVGFFSQGKVKKIDVSGGPPQIVASLRDQTVSAFSGAWGGDDVIVFSPGGNSGLLQVPATGGTPVVATTLDAARKEQWHRFPSFLPDGRHFLYLAGLPSTVYVASVGSKESTMLASTDAKAIYSSGHLLFSREGTLMAQPFDASALKITGEAVPIVESVSTNRQTANASFSATAGGVLTYRTGTNTLSAQMAWFDRSGRLLGNVGPPGDYRGIDVSSDGKRVATHQHADPGGGDDWIIDADRGTVSRFTFDTTKHYTKPIWSPNGDALTFALTAGDKVGVYRKSSGGAGTEEFLTGLEGPNTGPTDWSHDGRLILYVKSGGQTGRDIWALPLDGDRKPFALLKSEFDEDHASLSPDGRWLTYQSNETGRPEVYVQPFPLTGGKWQISSGGGGQPRWRQDGKELYYVAADRKLMAVDIASDAGSVRAGVPTALFDTRMALNGGLATVYMPYAVVDNGRRFLVASATKDVEPSPITVVLNWTTGLKK